MSRALWFLRIAVIQWHKMTPEERRRMGDWPNDPRWDEPIGDAWIQLFAFLR